VIAGGRVGSPHELLVSIYIYTYIYKSIIYIFIEKSVELHTFSYIYIFIIYIFIETSVEHADCVPE